MSSTCSGPAARLASTTSVSSLNRRRTRDKEPKLMQVGGSGSMRSDINVTPLVDVVLVLLIIFMVITPVVQMGYLVKVPPKAPPGTPLDLLKEQIVLRYL